MGSQRAGYTIRRSTRSVHVDHWRENWSQDERLQLERQRREQWGGFQLSKVHRQVLLAADVYRFGRLFYDAVSWFANVYGQAELAQVMATLATGCQDDTACYQRSDCDPTEEADREVWNLAQSAAQRVTDKQRDANESPPAPRIWPL